MSDITEQEWQILRKHFGDLAYEEPHNHRRFLETLREIAKRAENNVAPR